MKLWLSGLLTHQLLVINTTNSSSFCLQGQDVSQSKTRLGLNSLIQVKTTTLLTEKGHWLTLLLKLSTNVFPNCCQTSLTI